MGIRSKVITFAKKADGTGAQPVTGVGFVPRAVILFMVNTIADGVGRADVRSSVGFSGKDIADAINSYSAGWAADAGADPTNTTRKISNKALTIVQWSESLLAECDMTSFDADGFTLDWTTNDAVAYRIMALCLGGSSLTAAKAFTWNTPAATGAQAVTGIGFQPECLLTLRNNANTTITTGAAFSIGASDGTTSWLTGLFESDAAATSVAASGQRTGQVVGSIDAAKAWANLASLTSFDADGFTLNWSARTNTNMCLGLALNGGSYKAGTTAKSSSTSVPVSQSVTGVGFEPTAVLNASVFGGSLTGAGVDHATLSIGASGNLGANMAVGASRQEHGAGAGDGQSYNRVDKVIEKFNASTNSILAEASQVCDADGFTWSWNINDAVGSIIPWLAFGPHEAGAAVGSNSQVIIAG